MTETKQKIINNFSIRKLTDSQNNHYYLVIDNDNSDRKTNGYFCFNGFNEAFELISSQYNQSNQHAPLSVLNIEYTENENNSKVNQKIIKAWID